METNVTAKPKKPFDFGQEADTVAACNHPLPMELLAPDKSKTGTVIHLLGRDSDQFREVTNENSDAATRRAMDARSKGRDAPVQTQEEALEEGIALLVACTTGWDNMFVDGEMVPFTVENAFRIYRRFPSIRRQVDQKIGDVESFLKNWLKQ